MAAKLDSVELLSKTTILVKFTDPLSNDEALVTTSNYTIAPSVNVTRVLALDPSPSLLEVVLVVKIIAVGSLYNVTASGLTDATGDPFDDTVVLTFVGRSTKLDKVLTSTPILYDTAPSSLFRQLLTAIHREDDKIGGSESEDG